jgi:hypothetical protein
MAVLIGAGVVMLAGAVFGAESMAEMEKRFHPETAPIRMTYDITYRFLGMELGFLGRMELVASTGKWKERVSGNEIPVAFIDVRVRSKDCLKGEGGRSRINDRMVAVLEIPSMNALIFAKEADERLNPVFGRSSVVRTVSCYDTQSGTLDYVGLNLATGNLSTNLSAPEAIFELSRKIGGVMSFLAARYTQDGTVKLPPDAGKIAVNLDGQVVKVALLTNPAKSPVCLDHRRFPSLHVATAMERGSTVRAREFHAWGVLFSDLAKAVGDDGLKQAVVTAPINALVPLVMDYELALGSVRVVMKGSAVGEASPVSSSVVESPEPVDEKHAAADNRLSAHLGHEGGPLQAAAKEPHQRL